MPPRLLLIAVTVTAGSLLAQSPAPVASAEPVRPTYPVPGMSSSSTAPAAAAPALPPGVSAPSGDILSANDQVAVEVFGEDDLRTNGRLNGEGNLSVPLIGSAHLAGLTLTQAHRSLLSRLPGQSQGQCDAGGLRQASFYHARPDQSPGQL